MEAIETIRKKMQSQALFNLNLGGELPILKFVQVGKANRMNTPEQATILVSLRFFAEAMGFNWCLGLCDHVEDFQTTCGVPTAETQARVMLQDTMEWQQALEYERNRHSLTLESGGKK